jgi:hypothetical protein
MMNRYFQEDGGMKRAWILMLGFTLLASTIIVAAEKGKKVNFSGTWILDQSKTDRGAVGGRGGMGRIGGGRGGSIPGGGRTGGGGRNPGGSPTGGRRGGGGNPAEIAQMKDASIVIEHSDSTLKVIHKVADSGEGPREYEQTFMLDGSESANRMGARNAELKSRTSWEKDKLVTLGTMQPEGSGGMARSTIIYKQEMTLSKDGKTLTLKIRVTTPGEQITTTETFLRQPAAGAGK